MIKKRLYLIIAAVVAIIALICAYVFVVAPMLEEEDTTEKLELLEGETFASSTTILMRQQECFQVIL